MLYKRADLENNDAWWYRAKLKGKIGYIRRSTRETERVLAERFAVEEWHNLLGKQKAGLKLTAKLVRDVVKDFFEQVSATKTERRAKYQFNTWYRYMDGYFGEQKISEITDGFVEGYWNYRKGFYVWGEGKGQGWFAYQIYKKRDFSTDAAFHTLGKARDMKSKLLPKQKQLGFLVEDSIRAVEQVERLICDYLYEKHNITECVLAADIAINTSTNCLVGKARNDFY